MSWTVSEVVADIAHARQFYEKNGYPHNGVDDIFSVLEEMNTIRSHMLRDLPEALEMLEETKDEVTQKLNGLGSIDTRTRSETSRTAQIKNEKAQKKLSTLREILVLLDSSIQTALNQLGASIRLKQRPNTLELLSRRREALTALKERLG